MKKISLSRKDSIPWMELRFSIILFLILPLIFIFQLTTLAEIRYVSKTGSSTPPFLTWETAADSIMECINICQSGDTIYVANGVYNENVVMIAGIALIGAGTDSCIIDTRTLAAGISVKVVGSCAFKNFRVNVSNPDLSGSTGIQVTGMNPIVSSNLIENAGLGISCYSTNGTINHNLIRNISIFAPATGIRVQFNQPKIDTNIIIVNLDGITLSLNSYPIVIGNVISLDENSAHGIWSGFNLGAIINNNIIIAEQAQMGIYAAVVPMEIINNTIIGNITYGIWAGKLANFKNNSVTGGNIGIRKETGDTLLQFQYNNVWGNDIDYYNYTPDSTNISADPMYVDEDSLDFHLQMFSPLIDAGDPSILDKDGSRSDIGLFGGPYGDSYTYRDLAPRPPSNLTAVYDSGFVLLRWNKNTEADFQNYRVYRDTIPDFMYDSTRLIGVTADSFYYDDLPEKYIVMNYYYKITAIDSTGHQSAPSEEVHLNITGASEGPPVVVEHYQLLNNYPNPFNSSTMIPYRLKEPGYVKLYIYDIKGEVVSLLVNGYQQAGYYEVRFSPTVRERKQGESGQGWWTGYNDDIATGIYLYQIMVRGEGNIPVFTDMGKMILLK